MIVKYLFLIIFALLFFYGLLRPFSSIFARLFLIVGSMFGFISLLSADYVNRIALFVGVENATLLYLYFGLVTIFDAVGTKENSSLKPCFKCLSFLLLLPKF